MLKLKPPPVELLRPEDLLSLHVSFVGLRWGKQVQGEPPTLVRADQGKPAYLVVGFPSQHIIEKAYFQPSEKIPLNSEDPQAANPPGPETPDTPPVFSSISWGSRLVFKVGDRALVYTTEGLLDAMSKLDLSVAPNALPAPEPEIKLTLNELFKAGVIGLLVPDSVIDFGSFTRMASTAARLDHRFGVGTAEGTLAASRVGRKVGIGIGVAKRVPVFELQPPIPSPPGEIHTSIELPWRLLLSPSKHGAWAHSQEAVEHEGRTELWHTRLGVRSKVEDRPPVDERSTLHRTVRAIWARDFDQFAGTAFGFDPSGAGDLPDATGSNDDPRHRFSLNSRDRMMLVHETSNFRLTAEREAWVPPPVQVDRMMLSTLGGWLDSRVNMSTLPDGNLSIEEWKHRATMGRDHEVKVVYAGFLMPFGHRASLVKVTERKFRLTGSVRTAYLFQRMFIIVREPEKVFTANFNLAGGESSRLQMPLASVRIVTRVTPDLDDPALSKLPVDPGDANPGGFLFTPYVAGAAFPFKIVAVDREGNLVEFKAPLAFMEYGWNASNATVDSAVEAYNDNAKGPERLMPLHGQKVAFADSTTTDDTVLSTDTVSFEVRRHPGDLPQAQPKFLPVLKEAVSIVPAMSALAGAAAPVTLVYPAQYKKTGFSGNAGEVFLQLKNPAPMNFAGQGNRSGGFVTPSLSVTALSRATGPIGGDPAKAISGDLDLGKFFEGISAKLFGVVSLSTLLKAVDFDPGTAPKFIAQTLDVATTLVSNAGRLLTFAQSMGAAGSGLAAAIQKVITQDLPKLPTGQVTSGQLAADLAAVEALLGPFRAAVEAKTGMLRSEMEKILAVVKVVEDQLAAAAAVADLLIQAAQGFKLPEVVTARLDWATDIPRYSLDGGASPVPAVKDAILSPVDGGGNPQPNGKLTLAVEVQAPTAAGREPNVLVSCAISPLDLRLIAPVTFLIIRFEKMEFSVVPGKKPDVNVVLRKNDGVVFAGPLEFVNTLKDLIPFDGFSDPPYLDVTSSGIDAGFDLPIPSIAVGVFSLENIALGANFRIPFIDESLEVGFNFCTREDPFRLTVMLFGGGGFFGLSLTPDGVRVLEAAFEFGAAISVNLGVASGGVSIMAGIYFKLEMEGGQTNAQLSGYFRLRGEVDVLGLISASIELYLEFTYETATKKAVGRATITVEVEVLFLSFTVEISCEKKFAGGNEDPTFVEQMGLPAGAPPGAVRPWETYCRAFADA